MESNPPIRRFQNNPMADGIGIKEVPMIKSPDPISSHHQYQSKPVQPPENIQKTPVELPNTNSNPHFYVPQPQIIVQQPPQLPPLPRERMWFQLPPTWIAIILLGTLLFFIYVSNYFYKEWSFKTTVEQRDLYHFVEQAKRTARSFEKGHLSYYTNGQIAREEN